MPLTVPKEYGPSRYLCAICGALTAGTEKKDDHDQAGGGKLRSELVHSIPLEARAQDKELVSFEPLMGNLEEAAKAMGRAVLSLSQFLFLLSCADL